MQSLFDMEWDRALLRTINARWHNPFFDWLMPFLRNADTWVPLYLFLILFVLLNYRKTGWWWVLAAAATPALADFVSSHLLKEFFFRLRPCNEPAIASWLRILPGLSFPQSSSFTSSHATNHFAMAVFLFMTLKNQIGNLAWLFYVWAASICYAQVYVGVHYPFDVICGGIIGALLGWGVATIFKRTGGLQ